MLYRRCGRSGLKLPAISLGLWHNFGADRSLSTCRDIITRAFDLGVTHIDLANNYGPPAGSAEETFGQVVGEDLRAHRDELIVSTKAGYWMWDGPYGEWGSRKYLLASLDQSLQRMGLDYVDIFYSHRFDPETPLEETMGALDAMVRQGKALYIGISSYSAEQTREAAGIARGLGTPVLIHQPSYSMLDRWIEPDLLDAVGELGIGCIVLLAAGPGTAHRPLSRWDPRGLARKRELGLAVRARDRRAARDGARAERDRRESRPVDGPARARVDAARPAGDLDADRCEQRRLSSSRTSPRSTASTSPRTSSRRSSGSWPPSAYAASLRSPHLPRTQLEKLNDIGGRTGDVGKGVPAFEWDGCDQLVLDLRHEDRLPLGLGARSARPARPAGVHPAGRHA